MRNRLLIPVVVLVLAVGLLPPAIARAGGSPPTATSQETLFVNFGDFRSRAVLSYPRAGPSRHPTVLLIPGGPGPVDLNADVGMPLLSHIFLDIARFLTPRGFAVLRYNKHYVTSYTQVDDRSYHTKLDLPGRTETVAAHDAEQVLRAAEADPHVDPRHIFLYGWSEGSSVAAALAVRHPELAGLIVQGPHSVPWPAVIRYRYTEVGLPYLRRFAPDGRVTNRALQQAVAGNGGLVARFHVLAFADPSKMSGPPVIDPHLDANHDGAIEIDTEFLPRLDALIDSLFRPGGDLFSVSPGHGLPIVTAQAPRLRLPVLILQGANDANVPVRGARLLNAALAGNRDHTLLVYQGLGHSLGPAASVIDDNFRPIAPAPLIDLASWLRRHT